MNLRNKKKYIFLVLLIVCFGVPMLLHLPSGALDVRTFYTKAEATQWLESLTYQNKVSYFIFELLDLGYIVSYSALAYLLLGKLALIPGLLDLMEDVPIILFLSKKCELPEYLGVISGLKWVAGFLLIVFAVLKFRRMRGSR